MSFELMLELARMEVGTLYSLLALLGDMIPVNAKDKINKKIFDLQPLLTATAETEQSKEEIASARVVISNMINDLLTVIEAPLTQRTRATVQILADRLSEIDALPSEQYNLQDTDALNELENNEDYLKKILKKSRLPQLLSKIRIDLFFNKKKAEAHGSRVVGIENIRSVLTVYVAEQWNINGALAILLSKLIAPRKSTAWEIEECHDDPGILNETDICLELARIEKNHLELVIDELDVPDFVNGGNYSILFDRFYELSEPLQNDNLFGEKELSLEEIKGIRVGMNALYHDILQALTNAILPLLPEKMKSIEIASSNLEAAKVFFRRADAARQLSYPRLNFSVSPFSAIQEVAESLKEARVACQKMGAGEGDSMIGLISSSWTTLHKRAEDWIACPDKDIEHKLDIYAGRLGRLMERIQFLCREFFAVALPGEISQQCHIAQELFELAHPLQTRKAQKISIESLLLGEKVSDILGDCPDRRKNAKRKTPSFVKRMSDNQKPPLKQPFLFSDHLRMQSEEKISIKTPSKQRYSI